MDHQISYAPKAREDLLCHNYLSFYRYLDRTIYIDRILNSRRDYLKILLDEVH